jgi:hypothetical protein
LSNAINNAAFAPAPAIGALLLGALPAGAALPPHPTKTNVLAAINLIIFKVVITVSLSRLTTFDNL